TEPLAGNVRDQKRGAAIAEWKDIEIISTDSQAREVDAAHCEVRIVAEIFRKQGLLDVARDTDFLLQALAFALALHEARVVENAGGVCSERVENLPIELGKRRRTA